MGAQTESQVVALELERVRDKLPTLYDYDDGFFTSIGKKDVETISSRDMRVPLELRPGGNFGYYNPDGGDLGRGSAITYDKATLASVHLKHGVEVTYKARISTDEKRKAIVKNFQRQLVKGMAEFRRQTDAQCMGAGDGAVGTITSIATAGGKDTYTCTTDGFGVKLLRFAQFIAVYDAAFAGSRVITASAGAALDGIAAEIDLIDPAAKTVRIKGAAAAVVATDRLVVNGLSGATPVGLFGVQYHHNDASTGTWLGFDRALFPEIRANRVNAASGALALPFARLALNKIGDRVGMDKKVNAVAWMHPAQVQAYEELGQLVSEIHKSPRDESLNLYFSDSMQMAGATVKPHFLWDKTRIDFIVGDTWGRAELDPVGYYEVEGRRVFEVRGASGGVATSDIFYLKSSWNAFVDNPARCSYISNLAVPTGY